MIPCKQCPSLAICVSVIKKEYALYMHARQQESDHEYLKDKETNIDHMNWCIVFLSTKCQLIEDYIGYKHHKRDSHINERNVSMFYLEYIDE